MRLENARGNFWCAGELNERDESSRESLLRSVLDKWRENLARTRNELHS